MYKKSLTSEQALQKLRAFCGYQERSHQEVERKLYDLGVWKQEHDAIIATLIETNYLNEERFVKAYAGGRFRMKHWGRVKIRYELKLRKISEYLIRKAMEEIPEDDYHQTMEKLIRDKYESLGSDQFMVRKKKTIDYMISRGFETQLVIPVLDGLIAVSKKARQDDDADEK